jgi:hypothetical protein
MCITKNKHRRFSLRCFFYYNKKSSTARGFIHIGKSINNIFKNEYKNKRKIKYKKFSN